MPQFIVEYTDNIKAAADIPALLKKVNDTIMAQEGGIFPPGGTRSRAIELRDYRMADGVEDYAFVHATFKIGSSPHATWHCRWSYTNTMCEARTSTTTSMHASKISTSAHDGNRNEEHVASGFVNRR